MLFLGTAAVPAFSVVYRSAAHGRGAVDVTLPVERLFTDALPEGLSALLVTSDLQGHARNGNGQVLLGIALAEAMGAYCAANGIARAAVGVLLAGDLYAIDDLRQRGGVGDVRPVWRAFAQHAGFVAGVAGNHDAFGTADDLRSFAQEPGIALLDVGTPGLASHVDCKGLRIAGVSGIVGNPARAWRKEPDAYVEAVAAAIATEPDVLLLHQNPALPGVRRDEQTRLTQLLAAAGRGLVVFGHAFSPEPQIRLGRCRLLATEGRAFWIERQPRA
jgi:3',5'-cyclic-AMP phosphodiesterase